MKKKSLHILSSIVFIIVSFLSTVSASDLSDAKTLRKRCETEIKQLKVVVMNFGNETDKGNFAKAQRNIKMGKLKMIQTKYKEAIEQYNKYLKIHHNIYKSLSKKYITRTTKLIDDVGMDLVDYIDKNKVEKYLQMASQNLNDAKSSDLSKHYKSAVKNCRRAKEYVLNAYKQAGKKIPVKYKVDIDDIAGKISTAGGK